MLRGAALAVALLLSGSTGASATPAPITEIGLGDCSDPYGRPLVALVLTPDGSILRATTPILPDGTVGSPVFDRANMGPAAYREIALQIEKSSFFELSHGTTAVVTSDSRDTLVSAVRSSRRMTWATSGHPTDRHTMIMAVWGAIYARSHDSSMAWIPTTATADPFALCREPVQR